MYPYAPPETVLRHLAEQADRDRRTPHRSATPRGDHDDRDRRSLREPTKARRT